MRLCWTRAAFLTVLGGVMVRVHSEAMFVWHPQYGGGGLLLWAPELPNQSQMPLWDLLWSYNPMQKDTLVQLKYQQHLVKGPADGWWLFLNSVNLSYCSFPNRVPQSSLHGCVVIHSFIVYTG